MSRNIVGELFRLGWPVFVAQLAIMGNGVIDTVMAGRYSTVDLAAVGIGAAIYATVFITLMGVLLALTPIAAQLYGAGKHAEIGEEVRQSAWLALFLSLIAIALLRYPEPFLALSQLAPEVDIRVRGYLDALTWSVPAALLFRLFYSFSTAVSRPRVVMALNLVGLALKVPLNWVFMYGHFGAPEMGGIGCAVATAITAWLTCVLAWIWCYLEQDYARYQVFARFSKPRLAEQWRIVALGLPVGMTFLVDVTGFTFMALFIARLGALNSGAHQIASNVAAVIFMLPLAVGNAASVLVGQAIGARQMARARSVGITGIAIGAACAASTGILLFFNADAVAGLYTKDAGVRTLTAALIALVAVYHLFDGLQAVTVNVLRGYKRTVVPMLVYAVALWGVGLGGGYLLGLTHVDGFPLETPMGATGFWIAAIASLVVASVLVTVYFLAVSRRAMHEHGGDIAMARR
jgi:MATE family multidrug resistance protein